MTRLIVTARLLVLVLLVLLAVPVLLVALLPVPRVAGSDPHPRCPFRPL